MVKNICPIGQVSTALPTAKYNEEDIERVESLLDNLDECLQTTLPFYEQYLLNNPRVTSLITSKVVSEDHRVVLEAVEGVARNEVQFDTVRLMTSVVSMGFSELTDSIQPKMKAHGLDETSLCKRIVLCYGFISRWIPKKKLEAYLECVLLHNMDDFFSSEDPEVRASVCFCLSLMARAVRAAGVTFPLKGEMLDVMMTFIRDQPSDGSSPSICQQVLHTCFFLSQVRLRFKRKLMDVARQSILDVLTLPSVDSHGASLQELYSGNAGCLLVLLEEILQQDCSPDTLLALLEPLQALCSSPCGVTRLRAMTMLTALLQFCRTQQERNVPICRLLAFLVLRCRDPELAVTKEALKGIRALLDSWQCGKGRDSDREMAYYIRGWIDDETLGSNSCDAVVQVFSELLPLDQKQTLIQGLLVGLQDPQPSSAQRCCALLCQLLMSHPNELTGLFPQVLHAFLDLFGAEDSVRQSAKEGVLWLVFQDSALAIESLISHPPPADHAIQYQQWHRELWGAIGASSLGPWTFRVLVEMLQSANRSHTWVVCAVLGVVAELSLEEVKFAELFTALLPLLGAENSDTGFAVHSLVVESLRVLLSRAQLGEVAQDWGLIQETGQEPEGIFQLTRALKTSALPVLPEVVWLLWQRYGSADQGQKICIAAFFSALLRPPYLTDRLLLTMVMNWTLEMCKEPLEGVRLLAMQGLKVVPMKEMHRYTTEQLKLLSGALSQWAVESKPVVLRAVSSLGTILQLCADGTAQKIIPKIYHTAKECLENPDSEIRGTTVLLLGDLMTAASVNRALQKQCHGSLARLLLHLQDSHRAVSQACQRTLRQCAPALGCPTLTDLIEGHLSQETFDFTSFMRDVAAVLQAQFPGATPVYRRCALCLAESSAPHLRAGAAVSIGALLENMDNTLCGFCASWRLKKALSALLKDSDPRVQRKAAEVKAGFPQR